MASVAVGQTLPVWSTRPFPNLFEHADPSAIDCIKKRSVVANLTPTAMLPNSPEGRHHEDICGAIPGTGMSGVGGKADIDFGQRKVRL